MPLCHCIVIVHTNFIEEYHNQSKALQIDLRRKKSWNKAVSYHGLSTLHVLAAIPDES